MFSELINWFTGLDFLAVLMYAAALALYIAGYLGAVLPYPGCLVALGGSVCYAVAAGAPYPAWWFWILLSDCAISLPSLRPEIQRSKSDGNQR